MRINALKGLSFRQSGKTNLSKEIMRSAGLSDVVIMRPTVDLINILKSKVRPKFVPHCLLIQKESESVSVEVKSEFVAIEELAKKLIPIISKTAYKYVALSSSCVVKEGIISCVASVKLYYGDEIALAVPTIGMRIYDAT